VSELDRCLADFEAEFEVQESEPQRTSPIAGKVWLGVEQALMAQFLDADLGQYYGGSAEDQIIYQLRAQLFRRHHLPGNNRLWRGVHADAGIALTATVLGVPWTIANGKEPWARGVPPIRSIRDLDARPLPDFQTAGMMPVVLGKHAEMKRLLGPSFSVGFPGWGRGPLGNAFYLAGAEQALMSMYTDREFYHRLMRYGMDAMKSWLARRSAFLNEPVPQTGEWIWNDEVSAENFPPGIYSELVAPYDREYAEFFGGRVGFHSCGNTTPLMEAIAAAGAWSDFHVSAWSDLAAALRVFPGTPLHVSLHPYREVLGCPLRDTERRVREIVCMCAGRRFFLGINELMPVRGPAADLQRIKDVWSLCEDVFPAAGACS